MWIVSQYVSHQISSYHPTNHTLHLLHLFISLTLSETLSGSTQLCQSSHLGSIMSSHPLSMFQKPETLFVTNSCRKAVGGAS